MVTTRGAGRGEHRDSSEDRFVFADFKLIGALGRSGCARMPKASTPAAAQTTLAVTVAADGRLTLDGSPVADSAALARATKARVGEGASPADAHAVTAAYHSAVHGAVIGAIDALRTAGVTKIAFAVDRQK